MTDAKPDTQWQNRIIGYGVKPADQFTHHPKNPKFHPQNQRDALRGAIGQVGIVAPVVENVRTGYLVDGHERVWLALETGEEVPYVQVDLSPEEEDFVLVTLDPIGWLASHDKAKLDDLLRGVNSDSAAIQQMLSDLAVANGIVPAENTGEAPDAQIDKADELQRKWQTARGQLWVIPSKSGRGEHRLLCGDSTSADDVARVMDGEKARVVITSPPYSDQRDYEIGDFNWLTLMSGVSKQFFKIADENFDALINLGLSHKKGSVNRYWDEWLDVCTVDGWDLYGWYVWDKGSGFPGEWNGRLAPAHEFVFHFNRGRVSAQKWVETSGESLKRGSSGKRFRQKDGSLKELTSPDTIGQPFKVPDSVIRVGREMARGVHTEVHPAVFPPDFAEFMIRTWTNVAGIVYEPFSGSGTTLVACEQTGRFCRAIEIEPKYVAVALQRLADMGLAPRLVG